nr:iron transporter [uncultured Catonella sp.]
MKKKILSFAIAAAFAVTAVTGCGQKTDNAPASKASSAKTSMASKASSASIPASKVSNITVSNTSGSMASAAAPGEEAGFTEIPIFEDEKVAFLNVSAVYFQPVPMSPGQEKIDKENEVHLEADISALENKLGYGTGDWVPYLTIDYLVSDKDGKEVSKGTFMPMSASDGPHYGANVKMGESGSYKLKFTIHNPAENGYLIHSDAETGPGDVLETYFKDGNLMVEKDWDYVKQSW